MSVALTAMFIIALRSEKKPGYLRFHCLRLGLYGRQTLKEDDCTAIKRSISGGVLKEQISVH